MLPGEMMKVLNIVGMSTECDRMCSNYGSITLLKPGGTDQCRLGNGKSETYDSSDYSLMCPTRIFSEMDHSEHFCE